jgi:hypothetical protein
MKTNNLISTSLLTAVGFACLSLVSVASAQTIDWGAATGITGDADLVTSGTYLDAFLTNTSQVAPITVDGITFNPALGSSSTSGTDGIISFNVTSGTNNQYSFTTFSNPAASAAFTALMKAGGVFQTGGAGAGTVTISNLTLGNTYSVQVFNWADDSDAGLTTLSGSNSVTLSNLNGAGGVGTNGEFATGTFVATSLTETFGWEGAGSGFTVLGPISVEDLGVADVPEPSTCILMLAGVVLLIVIRRRRQQV